SLAWVAPAAADRSGAGGALATIGKHLADAHAGLRQATDWLLAKGLADANNALAGATPYLRMCGIVTGGWLLARSARAAQQQLDDGRGDAPFLGQKVGAARVCGAQ